MVAPALEILKGELIVTLEVVKVSFNPSSIYSWFLKPLSLCITLTISDQKIVSGSLFFQFLRAKKGKF